MIRGEVLDQNHLILVTLKSAQPTNNCRTQYSCLVIRSHDSHATLPHWLLSLQVMMMEQNCHYNGITYYHGDSWGIPPCHHCMCEVSYHTDPLWSMMPFLLACYLISMIIYSTVWHHYKPPITQFITWFSPLKCSIMIFNVLQEGSVKCQHVSCDCNTYPPQECCPDCVTSGIYLPLHVLPSLSPPLNRTCCMMKTEVHNHILYHFSVYKVANHIIFVIGS